PSSPKPSLISARKPCAKASSKTPATPIASSTASPASSPAASNASNFSSMPPSTKPCSPSSRYPIPKKDSAPKPPPTSSKGSTSCSPQLIFHITGISPGITNYHQLSPKHFSCLISLSTPAPQSCIPKPA